MPARKQAIERDEAVHSEDDLAGAEILPIQKKPAKPRVPTTKIGAKRKAPAKAVREVLADRTNAQDTDECAVEDELEAPKAKRAKPVEVKRKRAELAAEASHLKENVAVIAETQEVPSVEEIEQSIDKIEEAKTHQRSYNPEYAARAGSAKPPQPSSNGRSGSVQPPQPSNNARSAPVQPPQPSNNARSGSVQPSQPLNRARSGSVQPAYTSARERSVSASGTEREKRTGDVETRRQLTALTRECENLNLKNQALEDLVRDRAESNFDKLKKEADFKTKQADELIASLKKELTTLRKSWTSTAAETENVQTQLSLVSDAYDLSRQETSKLDQELAAAKQNLQTVENERKSLEAKLVAARQQLAAESSDSKSGGRIGVKSTEAQREAKMKESLYTDLTGLIIRGVKRKDGEDEYDCIQTGRNGTLHFHLSVMNENGSTTNPKTPGLSYEEAEFSYEPFLDESRDKDLLEILPDYLSEDICFPRNHAVKFYSKVVESMTKRIVIEED